MAPLLDRRCRARRGCSRAACELIVGRCQGGSRDTCEEELNLGGGGSVSARAVDGLAGTFVIDATASRCDVRMPVVSLVALAGGYLLVAADGAVFSCGAPFSGSQGGRPPDAPVVSADGVGGP